MKVVSVAESGVRREKSFVHTLSAPSKQTQRERE